MYTPDPVSSGYVLDFLNEKDKKIGHIEIPYLIIDGEYRYVINVVNTQDFRKRLLCTDLEFIIKAAQNLIDEHYENPAEGLNVLSLLVYELLMLIESGEYEDGLELDLYVVDSNGEDHELTDPIQVDVEDLGNKIHADIMDILFTARKDDTISFISKMLLLM